MNAIEVDMDRCFVSQSINLDYNERAEMLYGFSRGKAFIPYVSRPLRLENARRYWGIGLTTKGGYRSERSALKTAFGIK